MSSNQNNSAINTQDDTNTNIIFNSFDNDRNNIKTPEIGNFREIHNNSRNGNDLFMKRKKNYP